MCLITSLSLSLIVIHTESFLRLIRINLKMPFSSKNTPRPHYHFRLIPKSWSSTLKHLKTLTSLYCAWVKHKRFWPASFPPGVYLLSCFPNWVCLNGPTVRCRSIKLQKWVRMRLCHMNKNASRFQKLSNLSILDTISKRYVFIDLKTASQCGQKAIMFLNETVLVWTWPQAYFWEIRISG